MKSSRILKPQPGPQEQFLSSPADIVVYGGAAGGGKTYGLLLSALRYKNVRGYNCTVFRKTYKQVFSPGGLWDETLDMYHGIRGARARISNGEWQFRDTQGRVLSKVLFKHIGSDAELYDYQGSQICGLCFDELTHFSEHQFFYMLSRNRSVCGVKPYVRATCNPDADSWVAGFIEWWIDADSGYPIPERSGQIRWMLRRNNTIYWADRKDELIEQFHL
ncbi:MAG: terminase, partial [Oscillospiraceae bacterium]|nr:terminase [Oscillospiraceae bacterium]